MTHSCIRFTWQVFEPLYLYMAHSCIRFTWQVFEPLYLYMAHSYIRFAWQVFEPLYLYMAHWCIRFTWQVFEPLYLYMAHSCITVDLLGRSLNLCICIWHTHVLDLLGRSLIAGIQVVAIHRSDHTYLVVNNMAEYSNRDVSCGVYFRKTARVLYEQRQRVSFVPHISIVFVFFKKMHVVDLVMNSFQMANSILYFYHSWQK
jgi:hypothetical protein